MKLKVTQENLAKALNYVARVASTRSTLPILSNILLKIQDNQLSVSATNLDIAIHSQVGAQVQNEGSLTVPAKLLQELVSSLPTGIVELEQEDQKLKISTDQYKSVINGVSAEDFPVMPAIESGETFSIPAQTLREGLSQVLLAASNDESRPVLTGVIFRSFEGWLYMASTDSYRLAERKIMKTKQEVLLLIPATALHDVMRIIHDYSGDVKISYDDQQVQFLAGDVELVARLIDGAYPDYRKLIPINFETTATLPRTELTNIVKVTSLFARESAGSVVISVDEASESIWIRAVASQLGENNATAKIIAHGSGAITLNSRYLLDVLQVMNGKDVTIGFNGKLDPVHISDPVADDYQHIIMPLKS